VPDVEYVEDVVIVETVMDVDIVELGKPPAPSPRGDGTRIGGMTVAPRKSQYVGDRLLTVGEVAALMRVSNMTVYRLIKSGSLAAIRVGKNYRIRESDVNRYLSDRAVRPNGA
jgi:excisionase family DNA binding protein